MRSLALLCSTLALGAMACSSSDDTGDDTGAITQEEYDDVARSIGSSMATPSDGGEVGAMADVAILAYGDLPLGFTLDVNGVFRGNHFGLDYSYALTCWDVGGALVACDETTDRAEVDLHWGGALQFPGFTASVDRDGAWTLLGLQSDTITVGGDGSFAFDMSVDRGPQIDYALDYDAAYDVDLDAASLLPVGGTISYGISAQKSVDGVAVNAFTVDADVTFDANGATLTLDGAFRYDVDLATGVVVAIN
jgi:hypothetical protein